jgi:kexin
MRFLTTIGIFGLVWSAAASIIQPRDHDTRDYYAVHLDSSVQPRTFAESLGLVYEGRLGELKDHHLFSGSVGDEDVIGEAREDLRRMRKRGVTQTRHILDSVGFSQKQKLKPRMQKRTFPPSLDVSHSLERSGPPAGGNADSGALEKQAEIIETFDIKDPIFNEQWHLINTLQPGHDINITGVWMQGITGHNSTVALVDDGLDMYSDDLKDNYFAEGSYDFNDQTLEPRPRLSDDRHGTRCAGEIAAVKNNVCGVGVAWNSKVSGLRILSKQITDADEAISLNYAFQKNYIYSCSWGPPDDGQAMDAPGVLIQRAMLNGVQNGRGGKGSIFVFATGNGAGNDDNCNFDGYTNSIYSITVGAVDRMGKHPYYSEKCSAQLVVTYSSGSGDAIVSLDQ